jgi:hypothetical protein
MEELTRWIASLLTYLQSIDWNSINWSLVISILALVVSFYMAVLYRTEITFLRRQLNLQQKKYEEEQADKQRKELKISAPYLEKYENFPKDPLSWVGIFLRVNNYSNEEGLLEKVKITLFFTKDVYADYNLFKVIYRRMKNETDKSYTSFYLDGGSISSNNLENEISLLSNFHLVDRVTKQAIHCSPQNPYRLPVAMGMKQWYLFGMIPEKAAKSWMEENYSLSEIELIFFTNQGTKRITKEVTSTMREDDYEEIKNQFAPDRQ